MYPLLDPEERAWVCLLIRCAVHLCCEHAMRAWFLSRRHFLGSSDQGSSFQQKGDNSVVTLMPRFKQAVEQNLQIDDETLEHLGLNWYSASRNGVFRYFQTE